MEYTPAVKTYGNITDKTDQICRLYTTVYIIDMLFTLSPVCYVLQLQGCGFSFKPNLACFNCIINIPG